MGTLRFVLFAGIAVLAAILCAAVRAADPPGEDLVPSIVELLRDNDKDVRAVGLEQVRDAAKGESVTRRFAALLPQLPPEAQVGLLGALAERGDAAARPEVLRRIDAGPPEVRAAAIRTLGSLGDELDVARLVDLLAQPATEKDAAAAVLRLRSQRVNAALAADAKRRPAKVRAAVYALLVARHAVETVPALLEASADADAAVRPKALEAAGKLAGPEHVPALAKLVLRFAHAADGPSREQAELAVMLACKRIAEADQRAAPLLAFMETLGPADKTTLLPTLGRIGGGPARVIVEAAMRDADPARRAAGLRALCYWPDGSVAPQLLELAKTASDPHDRELALAALIRVAPLPDKRPDAERLAMLRAALGLATRVDQKRTILQRARAIRTLDALALVAPYMDVPELAPMAAETVVDLARHKFLRQPNKALFDKALDRAIEVSKDPAVIDRAKRFKANRT